MLDAEPEEAEQDEARQEAERAIQERRPGLGLATQPVEALARASIAACGGQGLGRDPGRGWAATTCGRSGSRAVSRLGGSVSGLVSFEGLVGSVPLAGVGVGLFTAFAGSA